MNFITIFRPSVAEGFPVVAHTEEAVEDYEGFSFT
jgi:hypothetical protein